jgi:hypothetical protein
MVINRVRIVLFLAIVKLLHIIIIIISRSRNSSGSFCSGLEVFSFLGRILSINSVQFLSMLNLSDVTSKFRTVAMFAIVDEKSISHSIWY